MPAPAGPVPASFDAGNGQQRAPMPVIMLNPNGTWAEAAGGGGASALPPTADDTLALTAGAWATYTPAAGKAVLVATNVGGGACVWRIGQVTTGTVGNPFTTGWDFSAAPVSGPISFRADADATLLLTLRG